MNSGIFKNELERLKKYAEYQKRELDNSLFQISTCELFIRLNEQKKIYIPIGEYTSLLCGTPQFFVQGVKRVFNFTLQLENYELKITCAETEVPISIHYTESEKKQFISHLQLKEGERREVGLECDCFSAAYLFVDSKFAIQEKAIEMKIKEEEIPTISTETASTTPVKFFSQEEIKEKEIETKQETMKKEIEKIDLPNVPSLSIDLAVPTTVAPASAEIPKLSTEKEENSENIITIAIPEPLSTSTISLDEFAGEVKAEVAN